MNILADARRRAFSFWLRTGRLPTWARSRNAELKFNPWHDPDDGRFTFAGTGRYFGRADDEVARDSVAHSRRRSRAAGDFRGGESGGGGASGRFSPPEPEPQRSREGQRPATRTADHPAQTTPPLASPRVGRAIDNPRNWHRVETHGYTYRIDALGRTREVSGTLTLNPAQRRSPSAQARAGGTDRRPSDHGGHYVAREFDGPPGGINLFAQDANFNRRDYRAMEIQWRQAVRANRKVRFRIVPRYPGSSRRPSVVNVWFWIDGNLQSVRFPNGPRRK